MIHALNIISLIGEVVYGIMIIVIFFNFTKLKDLLHKHRIINAGVLALTFIGFLRFAVMISI